MASHGPRPTTRQTASKQPAPSAPPTDKVRSPTSTDKVRSPTTPDPSNAVLQRDIADFSDKILSKLDNINTELQSFHRRLTDVESSVEFNSAKISEVENSIPASIAPLQEEISNLKEKLLLMEIYNRKPNLLFYGVESEPNEDIYRTLCKVFIHLGIDEETAKQIQMINAHRLPYRNQPRTPDAGAPARSRPAPIIAKFVKMPDRDLILSSFENLRRPKETSQQLGNAAEMRHAPPPPPRITVRTDLPPTLKAHRGHLAEIGYKLRKEKNQSTRIKLQGAKIVLQWKEKGSTTWNPYRE